MKNIKNILVRADSSSIIGTGHIMRDLVLATHYKDARITFATQELEGNINERVLEAGYTLEILSSNEIEELHNLIEKLEIDLVIIDHYGIDYKFEKKLKKLNLKLKILSFDDTYEKHYCDILLNHNIYADKKKYKNLVPKECELRCGSVYTLIRDEFIEAKSQKTIFLAMGGADTANINLKILKVLKNFSDIKVNVVTTTANKNLEELKKYCKNKKWIELNINSNEIAKIMNQSDFGIITPSVTANEAYFMSLPFIAIQTAENQKYMYEYLKENNYPILKKFDEKKLKNSIEKIMGIR